MHLEVEAPMATSTHVEAPTVAVQMDVSLLATSTHVEAKRAY